MKKKKRKFFIVLIILLLVPLIITDIAWIIAGDMANAAISINKLEENLYYMEYSGDYNVKEYIEMMGSNEAYLGSYLTSYIDKDSVSAFGCSVLSIKDTDNNYYYGRNFDSKKCMAMIVHAVPEDGYESFSTCDISSMGFGDEYMPDSSIYERIEGITTIYSPVDGMNSEGLMIADLTLENGETVSQDNGNPDVTIKTAIRLILDYANDCDSAISLLKEYDMHIEKDTSHHLFIADKNGNSIEVSYANNEMVVTNTSYLTNHNISDEYDINSSSYKRLEILKTYESGNLDIVKEALKNTLISNFEDEKITMWSISYDPNNLYIDFNFNEKLNRTYRLSFGENTSWEIL